MASDGVLNIGLNVGPRQVLQLQARQRTEGSDASRNRPARDDYLDVLIFRKSLDKGNSICVVAYKLVEAVNEKQHRPKEEVLLAMIPKAYRVSAREGKLTSPATPATSRPPFLLGSAS